MKNHRMAQCILILLAISLVSACQSGATTSVAPSTPTVILSELPNSTFIPTAQSSSTAPPQNTVVLKPTTPLSPTETLSVLPKSPPIPTLVTSERDRLFREYLRTNAGCSLPCIWGLEPGKDGWETIQAQVETWNLLQLPTSGIDIYPSSFARFSLANPQLAGVFTFFERDGVIQAILLGINDPEQVPFLDLKNVMEKLGKPYYVGIDLHLGGQKGNPKVVYVTIIVAYEDELEERKWPDKPWLVLDYSAGAVKTGTSYRFCPTNLQQKGRVAVQETAWLPRWVSVLVQSRKSPIRMDDLAEFSVGPDIYSSSGVSIEEFYTKIMDSNEPVCFYTPIEFWPDHAN